MRNDFLWKQDVDELLKLFKNTYNYCGLKLFLDTLRSIPGTPCFALCLEVDSCKVHVPSSSGYWGQGKALGEAEGQGVPSPPRFALRGVSGRFSAVLTILR